MWRESRLLRKCGRCRPSGKPQGNYSFNRFLTFTSLVQLDTSNAQAVSANLRLRYNYRPDSDLYIIYNVGTQFASIAPANPPQVRETRFAIKYTYSWQ